MNTRIDEEEEVKSDVVGERQCLAKVSILSNRLLSAIKSTPKPDITRRRNYLSSIHNRLGLDYAWNCCWCVNALRRRNTDHATILIEIGTVSVDIGVHANQGLHGLQIFISQLCQSFASKLLTIPAQSAMNAQESSLLTVTVLQATGRQILCPTAMLEQSGRSWFRICRVPELTD